MHSQKKAFDQQARERRELGMVDQQACTVSGNAYDLNIGKVIHKRRCLRRRGSRSAR